MTLTRGKQLKSDFSYFCDFSYFLDIKSVDLKFEKIKNFRNLKIRKNAKKLKNENLKKLLKPKKHLCQPKLIFWATDEKVVHLR